MKRIVLLGFVLCLSASTSFADNMVSVLATVPIPFADPLAAKKVVLDTETMRPTEKQIAELRPPAVIDSTEVKVEPIQINEVKETTKNETEVKNTTEDKSEPVEVKQAPTTVEAEQIKEIKEIPAVVQEEKPVQNSEQTQTIAPVTIKEDIKAISEEKIEEVKENIIAPAETKPEETVNEDDAIELNVGKGDLFVPNTKRKEIPAEKINAPKPEIYNTMPKDLHSLDIKSDYITTAPTNNKNIPDVNNFGMKYDVDKAFTDSEFGPYSEYKKEKRRSDLEYKLNPELSVKNTISENKAETKNEEPVVTLKSASTEEKSEDTKTEEMPKQFSAGEPANNQIKPGRKIFRF